MIFILSEVKDITTDKVCRWLNYAQIPFFRLNENEPHETIVTFEEGKFHVLLQKYDTALHFDDISCTWFRRGHFNFRRYNPPLKIDSTALDWMKLHLADENKTLVDFLYHALKQKKFVNDPNTYNYNKLIALDEASKVGLLVPATLLCQKTELLKQFMVKYGSCITKNIQDIMHLHFSDGYFTSQATENVQYKDIKREKYWYSLFQEEIDKKYELRIFYLAEKFYSMAIFSQNNPESMIDFRRVSVNSKYPNRMVPFTLPIEIQKKLTLLMKNLSLESGSIDMIVNANDAFYFLEVNPVGQFDFLSKLCNYYIEKDIASFLS
jgi:ATP-GRASP peptide maturase of grasp-with-spasm system